MINEGCAESLETNYSAPLLVETGKWGDISPEYASAAGDAQPNFNDIAASVQKFLSAPGAPITAQAQLQPNVVHPDHRIDFNDMAATVAGFLDHLEDL